VVLQVLLYGRKGWFAPALNAMGFNVVFAFPGGFGQSDVLQHQ
jgi:ABC-type sulfate transport system permease subunit